MSKTFALNVKVSDWAMYAAIDYDGTLKVFETRPIADLGTKRWIASSMRSYTVFKYRHIPADTWTETLRVLGNEGTVTEYHAHLNPKLSSSHSLPLDVKYDSLGEALMGYHKDFSNDYDLVRVESVQAPAVSPTMIAIDHLEKALKVLKK
jgi:hypothetical protein